MEANTTFEFQSPLLKPIKTGLENPTKDHVELGDPLSPMARLFHRPGSSLYIMGLLGSKTTIDPHHFKAGVESAFLAYPRFTSLLVPDKKDTFASDGSAKMRWVKTKVDIDQHVFFPKIEPKDTSHVGVDKFVEEYTREITGISMDMSKPLWDVHVLNLDKMTTQGAMAVALFRFHHSLGDGTSLMSLFMSFTRKASDPNAKPSLPVFSKRKPHTYSMSKIHKFLSSLRLLWNTLVDVLNLLATAFFLDDTSNPLKGPKDARQSPRRIILKSVPLEDIKFVKNITKTTLNDVVMGVIESALSRYLNRKYGEINQGGNKVKNSIGNLPQKLRFRATMYFNIRAVQGIQAVENMINKDSLARWGNQLGYVIYPFKIMMRDNNPLDYVYRAQTMMHRKKASMESYFSYHIGRFFLNAFGFKVASIPVNPTMWFSNMIGPQEEITIFGYPVAYLGCTCFGQTVALMIHVMSYADNLNFILSTDDDVISDPHEICNDLEQSLKVIKMAAVAKKK
uniref:Diacylglycerol O-acyltransferase n=1 Tax=Kalanchoe fedtschenkoi TaxID=63787 RepID=A0A7N0ULD3_KALFE